MICHTVHLPELLWYYLYWSCAGMHLDQNSLPDHTLLLQWFPAPARLYAYQPLLQIVQIPDVSSKDGAVIGAVLSM
jgi:hypothetical protein